MLSLSLRSASSRAVCSRRPTAAHVVCIRPVVHARRVLVRAAAGPDAPSSMSKLTDDLRLLETERDEAVKVGEECARTVVKLEEMVRLLEQLAMNKVQEGDDDGARTVLKEKKSVQDVLSRTSVRATTNFALASKLAEKIGQQQTEIMNMLQQNSSSSSSSTSTSSQPDSSSNSGFYHYTRSGSGNSYSSASSSSSGRAQSSSSAYSSDPLGSSYSASASPYSTSSGGSGSSSSDSSSGGGYEAPWEKSLRDARERVAEIESQAEAAGRSARYKARESVEEARERLRQQAYDSVSAARSRIKRSASESIAEAQARIAAEDAAALAEVHKVIDRYKAGGYVPEDELDWAFSQLERRSWRG